jgi:hypothetical protein
MASLITLPALHSMGRAAFDRLQYSVEISTANYDEIEVALAGSSLSDVLMAYFCLSEAENATSFRQQMMGPSRNLLAKHVGQCAKT